MAECIYPIPEPIIPPDYPSGECGCEEQLALKQDLLTAGENITIEKVGNDTVISATGGGSTYTAGNGIDITDGEISLDCTELMDCEGIVEMQEEIDRKQNIMTAGDYITIVNDEVSVSITKAELLELLEVTEVPITLTGANGTTVTYNVLGVRNNG